MGDRLNSCRKFWGSAAAVGGAVENGLFPFWPTKTNLAFSRILLTIAQLSTNEHQQFAFLLQKKYFAQQQKQEEHHFFAPPTNQKCDTRQLALPSFLGIFLGGKEGAVETMFLACPLLFMCVGRISFLRHDEPPPPPSRAGLTFPN